MEHELINLVIWMGKWLAQHGEGQEGLHYVTKSLVLFEDNINIYDALIELCRETSDEERLNYWRKERAKVLR